MVATFCCRYGTAGHVRAGHDRATSSSHQVRSPCSGRSTRWKDDGGTDRIARCEGVLSHRAHGTDCRAEANRVTRAKARGIGGHHAIRLKDWGIFSPAVLGYSDPIIHCPTTSCGSAVQGPAGGCRRSPISRRGIRRGAGARFRHVPCRMCGPPSRDRHDGPSSNSSVTLPVRDPHTTLAVRVPARSRIGARDFTAVASSTRSCSHHSRSLQPCFFGIGLSRLTNVTRPSPGMVLLHARHSKSKAKTSRSRCIPAFGATRAGST